MYARAHLSQWLPACALGQQADHASHAAAARSRAVEEGIRTAQHLDTLEEFGCHILARQQAIKAVVGNVIGINRHAAQHVQLLEIAITARLAHRRIAQ
ncbi:hypothetical protein SDC9_149457 [bioreactor metagenome]|uniref:Uncharacterized protein n=1 Tax=bioreactor metagenome TaxID=1076179 RepID=A0A645ENW9_9ZZZZ